MSAWFRSRRCSAKVRSGSAAAKSTITIRVQVMWSSQSFRMSCLNTSWLWVIGPVALDPIALIGPIACSCELAACAPPPDSARAASAATSAVRPARPSQSARRRSVEMTCMFLPPCPSPCGQLESKDSEVVAWRYEQLRAHGFDVALAARLAQDCGFDLHGLVGLVERG